MVQWKAGVPEAGRRCRLREPAQLASWKENTPLPGVHTGHSRDTSEESPPPCQQGGRQHVRIWGDRQQVSLVEGRDQGTRG